MPMPSKPLFALFLAIVLLIPQIQGAEPEVIDGVAAVVNGDVITFSRSRKSPDRVNGRCESSTPVRN